MAIDVRPCSSVEELQAALNVISHYFGAENTLEDAERFAKWIELERLHVALDGDLIIGGAGAFSFEMSVPGGASVPAAGVTVVGVLPTHRRRGVLTAMMKAQLADCRERGDAVAYLWASEGTIYGRFGYGLAARTGAMQLACERTKFAQPFEPRGTVRIVNFEEAAKEFPPLYEAVRVQRPGMFSRSKDWWETRRLFDNPERRQGSGPKNRVLLELDGKPAGYALYTVKQDWQAGSSKGVVTILEVIAPTPEASRELWRWLLDFDWTSQFEARLLPLDHELFLLLAEPRRMQFTVDDGVWVRPIDLGAALSARTYAGDGEIVLEVTDKLLPENAGRWHLSAGGAARTEAEADLRLDITGVGSVYLGGFGFMDLVRASRAEELHPGAAERGDALLGAGLAPWCAEIF
jgi:predicted acetyltransferase